MSYSIRFLKAAQTDITNAFEWYEDKRPGLGEDFAESLEAIFTRIKNRPTQFPATQNKARKAVIQRFPYNIFFRVDDSIVTIVAVFHTSQRPESWQQRLEE